ncbi:MAG TPA: hypothetical protein VLX85_00885 [Stellaceae bacterium]|nr:hypothetical protein [Stellaceae bacterium]
MKLVGAAGISFELVVVGYQAASNTIEYWSSNWLVATLRIHHPRGDWTYTGPSLATFELEQLAGWFEGVAQGHPDPKAGYFTESHLTFLYAPPPASAIEVRFAFEAAPPWLVDRNLRLDGAVLSFPLALNDPGACAQYLREELARFPQRGSAC